MKTIFIAAVAFLLACLALLPRTARAQDRDGDGMPDSWEEINVCLMGNTADGDVDYDADGLTNLQ